MSNVEARTVLWYLVFIGFAVNYMIRINLNITIVEMVVSPKSKTISQLTTAAASLPSEESLAELPASLRSASSMSGEINGNSSTTTVAAAVASSGVFEEIAANISSSSGRLHENFELQQQHETEDLKNASSHPISDEQIRFDWNEYQQGLVLGSFFWAHWVTQIPGGILAKKYGTKLVFGLANAIGCWMCFFIPAVSHWDYRALIVLRVLQGLVTGLAWPAMHVLTAKWIPPNERSKFVTAYLGSSVGIAVFYPFFGYIMHWGSWVWVYHFCGILGTVWWFGWLFFVYDSPAQHPRISESEVRYIEKSLGASVQSAAAVGTPWKAILLSRPVWMNVIAQWGGIWGLFTLMTQAPTYFRVIHNWNIRATGILSGLPHLMRMIFAYVFSLFADYLLKTEKMSRTNIRKLATAICCIVKGLVVVALAYFGHNSTAAIVYLTVATMFHGAVSSGPLASIVDIAPNFAGIVLGISGMIGVLPGFISPYIVGVLTLGNQTFESWKYVFLICAAMLIGSGVLYVLFAESTLQKWNDYSSRVDDKELMQLTKDDLVKPKVELDKTDVKVKAKVEEDGEGDGEEGAKEKVQKLSG
ncbi:sialin [Musca domestica]|uniref:Sialin-like n=1 Tax=Musca domestica TaxID=7370 RepID=A0A1I8MJQ1_MUSDO|nr:sialin [Musca domestica]